MDTDLYLVIGLVLGLLSIPSMLSAMADNRAPRAAAVLVLIAGSLIVIALKNKVGGYEVQDIPQAVFRVIGRYLH